MKEGCEARESKPRAESQRPTKITASCQATVLSASPVLCAPAHSTPSPSPEYSSTCQGACRHLLRRHHRQPRRRTMPARLHRALPRNRSLHACQGVAKMRPQRSRRPVEIRAASPNAYLASGRSQDGENLRGPRCSRAAPHLHVRSHFRLGPSSKASSSPSSSPILPRSKMD